MHRKNSRLIAQYKIIKHLGQGGMAEVFEAEDMKTKRHVALKVLLPHLASKEIVRQRFLREAKVGMALDHPGIVKVYEAGEETRPFIAMELLKGHTLDTIIEHKALPLTQVISFAKQITDALIVAHKQGIIHRDIKPRNIMITNDKVKIMDFGLARVIDTSSLTEKHEIIGTLYYMSPEQAVGGEIDARSDIFSLGVVLYQMLTGRRPFDGEHAGTVIHAILYSDPIKLNDIDRKLPKEVEQIIFKALQKKADQRYQSAIVLHSDLTNLQDVLTGKPVTLIASDISTEEVFEKHRGIYSVLVGREQEMDKLQKHIINMLQGKPSAILLSGETGIGKSRLAWEIGQKAQKQNVRYLMGRCVIHGGIPYQPLLEVIRRYFAIKGITTIEILKSYVQKHAENLLPRMDIITALVLAQDMKNIDLISRGQLWDTFTEIIKLIARDRPVVFHLDDLHWADAATTDLLTGILTNLTVDRMLFIGTYRPEEIVNKKTPLRKMLIHMRKNPIFSEISLSRLDKKRTQNIIHSVFENSSFTIKFTDSIYHETEGNPLFILEILKLLKDENIIIQHVSGWRLVSDAIKIRIPKSVSDVIFRRIKKLTKEEREIIDIAAVAGLSFQSDTLACCLQQTKIHVLRRLQNLESSHNLIHATKWGYQFDHGKIRDVVYENLIPELRREYHKIIGTYLKDTYPEQGEYAGRIAQHLLEADDDQNALPFLINAGEHAKKAWAHETALAHFTQGTKIINNLHSKNPSLDLQQMRFNIAIKRIWLYSCLGQNKNAREEARTAREWCNEHGSIHDKISVLICLGHAWGRIGEFKTSIRYYEQALTSSKKINDMVTYGYCQTSISTNYWIMGHFEQALHHVRIAFKIHQKIGNTYNQARDLYCLGMVYYIGAQFQKGLAYLRKSLKLFTRLQDKLWIAYTTNNIGACYLSLRHIKKAESFTTKSIQLLEKLGEKHSRDYAFIDLGIIYRLRGEYKRALDQFEHTLALAQERGEQRTAADLLLNIGYIHLLWGKFNEASQVLKQALKIYRKISLQRNESICHFYLGNIYLFRGDYAKARTALNQSLQLSRKHKLFDYQWPVERCLCNLWMNLGNKKRAKAALIRADQVASAVRTKEMMTASHFDYVILAGSRKSHRVKNASIHAGLHAARKWKLANQIAEGLYLAAETEYQHREFNKAAEYAQEYLRFASGKDRKPDHVNAHLLIAKILLRDASPDRAIEHARIALREARKMGMKEAIWQIYHILGQAYIRKGRYGSAYRELSAAERIIKRISSNLDDELRRMYLRSKRIKDLYRDLHKSRRGKKL